jgi:phosphoenolpyruvate carboxylase
MTSDDQLRREIDFLGRTFGDVIRRFEGEDAFNLIEEVRRLARHFTSGEAAAGEELHQLLEKLPLEELRIVVRGFSTFLELANLAEDRQRLRTLRRREAEAHPQPYRESIQEAIASLRHSGRSDAEVQSLLDRIYVELVFTAHPTEAKRRSLRSKLRSIRGIMSELDSNQLLPNETAQLHARLRGELIKLWQTDFIRPTRPTVTLEVHRGLSFQPVLWNTMPRVIGELREAVAANYPDAGISIPPVLRFGSWMGGDRDGHPFVTPDITAKTCQWLRRAALESHLETRRQLADSLSISRRQSPACERLEDRIDAYSREWPVLVEQLEGHGKFESHRRFLRMVRWRLEQTAAVELTGPPPRGYYASPDELASDVELIRQVLVEDGNNEVATTEVQSWLDQIAAFGFYTARLDVRQHSAVHRTVMEEIWRATGAISPADSPDEAERQRLLAAALDPRSTPPPPNPSEKTAETLLLFQTLRRITRCYGIEALGGHIISMTRVPSDLLTVLWLWKWSEQTDGGHPRDAELRLPVVPLFETITDLEHASDILATLLDNSAYRDWLRGLDDRQIVMIGYSDSTKDGGYLAACWNLQRVQTELHGVAAARGVKLTFFHGRGGSLGRGGGPASRAILSLPTPAFDGTLRLTEQGEILAERYDDPAVAFRHLEQVLWSVIVASTPNATMHHAAEVPEIWRERMDSFADRSFTAYRQLVDHPSFGQFFRAVTPIGDIESMDIGSRPSRRVQSDRIEDLRAIPWVFAWTQCRCLIPAWYGLGAALGESLASSPETLAEVRRMYREWPFFRATIDNAVLAVAKSNLPVFHRYCDLAGDDPGCHEIAAMIEDEWRRTADVFRAVTDCSELLDDVPWLKRSISARNGYVDPLNLIQVELQLRGRAVGDAEQFADLAHLRQLTVKGVAAGMRTTG